MTAHRRKYRYDDFTGQRVLMTPAEQAEHHRTYLKRYKADHPEQAEHQRSYMKRYNRAAYAELRRLAEIGRRAEQSASATRAWPAR
jgi:hypothetical protein